jgi:hypothetical protein
MLSTADIARTATEVEKRWHRKKGTIGIRVAIVANLQLVRSGWHADPRFANSRIAGVDGFRALCYHPGDHGNLSPRFFKEAP